MVQITWVPAPPENADAARMVIDRAFGPPYTGRVELRWEGSAWHVADATKLTGETQLRAETSVPVWKDMRDVVETALATAGFAVNVRFGNT